MIWLRWAVIAVAGLLGAWLTFDGTKAFATGSYVTPSTGPHAGQLGPWSKIVAAVGLEPRGTAVKSLHVVLGVLWLVSLVTFLWQPAIGWWLLVGCSLASLWYLPLGTVLALLELVLLYLPSVRDFAT